MFRRNTIILTIAALVIAVPVSYMGFKVAKRVVKKVNAPKRYNAVRPVDFKEGVAVFAASSLDRIFQDGKTLLKPEFKTSVSISLAKNEYESFQIVIETKNKELTDVKLEVGDLVDTKTKNKAESLNITFRTVGYVPTVQPYYPVKYVGLWPDPLMPLNKVDIASDVTQPFWGTVYASEQAQAGEYQGSIRVLANGNVLQTIPLNVRIYDFLLPKASRLKTAFDFYGHITGYRYPQGQKEPDDAYKARMGELNEQFIQTMIRYRQDPILNIDPSSQEDLGKVDRYLASGLNNFSIGKKGGTFDNNWPKSEEDIEKLLPLYRGYGESLKLNRMLEYTYIYTWDEGDMGNPVVARLTSMIHRAYPGLKNMVCYHGIWNPDDFPDWGKDIDIWCFNIDQFDEAKMRRLQEMGMEMWIYVSGPSGTGEPNLALDFDSIDYRILPWICWKYDVRGFLYWCVNWWRDVDPFKNARNTTWEQNGNGLLFYPGPEGPVASLRAEIFRDGMEDYEYIQTLLDLLKSMKNKGMDKTYAEIFSEGIRLLTVDASIAKAPNQFTKNQSTLKDRRNIIAEKIEQIKQLAFGL